MCQRSETAAEAFIRNCRWNDRIDQVNECLSFGVDVNTTTRQGDCYGSQLTGLMIACEAGNLAIVSRLVQESGLDINFQNEDGWTAAHRASVRGHTECVRILAETGKVDWNKRDKRCCRTPLFWALGRGHSDIVDIIVQQPNIDYNVQTEDGATLAQAVVSGLRPNVKCVETLAALESFDSWNIPDYGGYTPIMTALKYGETEIVEILLRCPRVDLSCRDKEGWSLLFRAIKKNKIDLVKKILSKLEKPYSGSSLARIAVEVGEEEDIRLLVQEVGTFDWNETEEDEDPAILWALKNGKFKIFDILPTATKINLQGDPSADLTINCGSETFRVHKGLLSYKSPVFRARLERWETEGEMNINTMNSNILSSMIHYIYTGELADGWQDLDIQDVTTAADMYDLPGWMELFKEPTNDGDI